MGLPLIIQGGMGAGVSGWPLARAVSLTGQLGVVAGTALPTILLRRLQTNPEDSALHRALEAFPFPEVVTRILDKYMNASPKGPTSPFKLSSMPGIKLPKSLMELTVVSNFVEVFLAKDGHNGVVGLNLLEKIQFPNLASIYGAMLAGVDYVLMGAGIPRAIPGVLDKFSQGEVAELKMDVIGAKPGEDYTAQFDPADICGSRALTLKRPAFLGIISSTTLAITLARKSSGQVNGFIIEGPTAGGHNAPPRGNLERSPSGEPIYGPRDMPDIEKIRALGLPFWLAGSYGRPGGLAAARALGAAGIQVGTAFAFSEESGIQPEIKAEVLHKCREGKPAHAYTDPLASPTGFPLKVVEMEGSMSDETVFKARPRICDLGYLRRAYRTEDGEIGYRCPAEPVEDYVRKGGDVADTVGRKCVCNGLLATIGVGQFREQSGVEIPLVTAGDAVAEVAEFLQPGKDSYTAADVVERLLKD